jgi:hypothetical protein
MLCSTRRSFVAIYGAGAHSVWLESVVADLDRVDVVAVLDDNPDGKQKLWGCSPVKPENWNPSPGDIVVISSDTIGEKLKKRCMELYGPTVQIVNLYDGFPVGPYPKKVQEERLDNVCGDYTKVISTKLDQLNSAVMKLNRLAHHGLAEQYESYRTQRNQNEWCNRSRFLGFQKDLWDYKDLHAGQRCFIIGNGPSLNDLDMTLLKNEITFGSNRIYLGFPAWGFPCTYWCIQDETQILQNANKYLEELPEDVTRFVPFKFMEHFDPHLLRNVVPFNFVDVPHPYPQFSANPSVIYNGWTVTYSLIQMALIMGCNPIYLIGIDHKYQIGQEELKSANRWTDSRSRSHFHPDYCDAENKRVWNVPDIPRMESAYQLAMEETSGLGVSVINATPGTALKCFPCAKYEDLF